MTLSMNLVIQGILWIRMMRMITIIWGIWIDLEDLSLDGLTEIIHQGQRIKCLQQES